MDLPWRQVELNKLFYLFQLIYHFAHLPQIIKKEKARKETMKSILSVKQKSDKSVENLMIAEEDYSTKLEECSTAGRTCDDSSSESLLFNDDHTLARFGSAVTVTVDSSISFSHSDPFMPAEVDETDGGDDDDEDEEADAGSVNSRHSRSSASSSGRQSHKGTRLLPE